MEFTLAPEANDTGVNCWQGPGMVRTITPHQADYLATEEDMQQ